MLMTRSGFRSILAACALAVAAASSVAAQTSSEFAVTGYVFTRNTLLAPGKIDPHALTRINYAFAIIRGGRIVTGAATDAENLAIVTGLRKQNPSLTVLVSVGGWLGSGGFSDAALTTQSRAVFVASVADFLKQYDLDGLDVDWEFPGQAGAGNTFRPEDKHNFTLLLKDLRKRFDREQKSTGRHLVLTIAAGANADYLVHTEIKKVQRYVDTVNVMAYDYSMASIDPTTNHSAPLFSNPAAPRQESADASLRAFERAGVPSGKILLGVPFYGHLWAEVPDHNHGLFQPGKPGPADFAPFSAIQQNMLGHGYTRYWDQAAFAPYLYGAEKQQFVSYDDAESLAAKCAYVKTHNLGGVMFWEYSDDPSGTLLETINRILRPAPAGTL